MRISYTVQVFTRSTLFLDSYTLISSSFLNSNPQDSISQVLFYFKLFVSWCAFLVFLRAISHCRLPSRTYTFLQHSFFSYIHKLPSSFYIFILSYSYWSMHSPPCICVKTFFSKFSMNASKMNENWKSSKMRDLWPWTDSLRCQYFTCIFYRMGKQGPFSNKLSLFIDKIASIYVQFFPIQLPGLFAVWWWARAAPTPTYRQIWKKNA